MASATCRRSMVVSTVGSSRRLQPGYNLQARSVTESGIYIYYNNTKPGGIRSGMNALRCSACSWDLPFPPRSKRNSHPTAERRFASSNINKYTTQSEPTSEYRKCVCLACRKPGQCHASKQDTASRVSGGHDYGLEVPWKDMSNPSINLVVKFGGSSVASAERMVEVAQIVCGFEKAMPVVVLSAMGKTTNLLLQAGSEALHTSPRSVAALQPLRAIKELHRETADKLGVDDSTRDEMESLLTQLTQLLVGISIMQDLTPRAKDSLVSFGERLSTRLFASFLRQQGIPATQYDAPDLGVITNDNFTNADVDYEATYPEIQQSLAKSISGDIAEIAIVTGFLGKGKGTGAITTLGRGGSDLTCTLIGAALGLSEVQVWKDVDGVLTSDPRIVDGAKPVEKLTFEEATELAFFGATVLHPLAMQPASECESMGVRVKNSYNRKAAGTLITSSRDMSNALVTSIVLKQHVTLVDIVSTRMLGQIGFLAKVFEIFYKEGLSVDVVATSEVSVSLTLDPAKTLWERDLIDEELEALMKAFTGVAKTSYRRGMSILSLICNVKRTSEILERVFRVLGRDNVNVQMMSQGASKTNISLIVQDSEATHALRALHKEFFDSY